MRLWPKSKSTRRVSFFRRARFRRARHDKNAFGLFDQFSESLAGLSGKPGRFILTTLSTVLGIASLVTTIGFAQTGQQQVSSQFDAVQARQMVVAPATAGNGDQKRDLATLPWDAPERVRRLNGVEDAGLISKVNLGDKKITAAPVYDPTTIPELPPTVLATSADLLKTVRGTIKQGSYFNSWHDSSAQRVAVLGEGAARTLGITRVENAPSIFIGGQPYTVIGIVGGMERRSEMLDSVIVPMGTARQHLGVTKAGELQVRIALGASPLVSKQTPTMLDPSNPNGFEVKAPASSSDLKDSISSDVNSLFIILGLVALLIGGLSIAVVTSMSIMERRGEIGLRRALGATQKQVAGQIMLESVIVGLLGGLIGSGVGTFGVLIASVVKGWTPVLDLRMVLGAAVLGAVVGLVAGLMPAMRAARMEPAYALQEGT